MREHICFQKQQHHQTARDEIHHFLIAPSEAKTPINRDPSTRDMHTLQICAKKPLQQINNSLLTTFQPQNDQAGKSQFMNDIQ
jgi:hypothetical protein